MSGEQSRSQLTATMINALKKMIEAVVFASDEPLTHRQIASIYHSVTGDDAPADREVEELVGVLNDEYEATDRAFRIHRWAGGYRLATEPSMAPFIKAMFAETNERQLSRSLMETLAIVAYKQPVTKPEVDSVRGVDSDYAIKRLLERHFVEVVGRSDALGRPLLYGTSTFFLEQFGLNHIEDLPKPREIEELMSDPAFNQERAKLLSEGAYDTGNEHEPSQG